MKLERELLTKIGQWDRSNVILLSDHGWNSSAEYDGHWDVRTPFLVKLADQKNGMDYYRPFNTVVLKDLVVRLMTEGISDVPRLATWLDERTEEETPNDHSS